MTASALAATPRNRLAAETSPYLLQHASNPVDWYPWGPEALARARELDRPILLSIGYSACHWCHVMAHESFEDEATARAMNELYVNVKIDREERPDLDRIYQLAHQLLTQRGGGWPLTMFLTPEDQAPFFGGTYFPREARQGMPAFRELLAAVARYYRERRDEIRTQNVRLLRVFEQLVPHAPADGVGLDRTPLDAARAALGQDFDADFGGFTPAPKFPHPGYVERLLRHWHATAHTAEPDLKALYMAGLTLARMAEGGLYDHVGGGFARYSVDAYWMIPHFEKMLYDNGPLLALYADAAAATGEALFRRAANGTADWVVREMQTPTGGFSAALDADSEGEEGRYYVWDRDAVRALLPEPEWQALAQRYGLDRAPNFEGRHWHLHAFASVDEVARTLQLAPEAAQARIDAGLARLAIARESRVRPGLDDKILAGWNGLAIRGLAIAARRLRRPELADAATRAADCLRRELWRDGRLHASWKDGRAGAPGYLDDHAFVADALLELLQVRWRAADLAFAIDLAEALLARFEDRERGGFWFTADDAETLIHRPKTFADEALPAGNGVAARVLQRLGWLLGEPRYLAAAERTLRAAWEPLRQAPHAHATLLDALEEWLAPAEIVIVRGTADEVAAWQRELHALYAPRRMVLGIPAEAADLPPALADKRPETSPIAYVCEGTVCGPPVRSLAHLVRRLRDGVELADA